MHPLELHDLHWRKRETQERFRQNQQHIQQAGLHEVCEAIQRYGGGFARPIGEALAHADHLNQQLVLIAFHDILGDHARQILQLRAQEEDLENQRAAEEEMQREEAHRQRMEELRREELEE